MSLTTTKIEKQLIEIEKKIFSNPILIDQIQVWPLIKDFFYFKQFEILRGIDEKKTSTIYKFPKHYDLKKLIWKSLFIYYSFLVRMQVVLKKSISKYLFLDVMNSEYSDEMNGRLYSKYITPYFESVSKLGKTSMIKITLQNEEKLLKTNESFEPKYILNAKKYFYLCHIHKMHTYTNQFDGVLKSVDSIVDKSELQLKYSNYSEVLALKLLEVQFYKKIANNILVWIKPEAVFIETYFGHPDYYGSILAAKKLNLPVIDIQHGNTSTIMYRGYSYEINNKSCLLPDYYWVWSQYEYDYVQKEGRVNNVLKPVLFGKHYKNSRNEKNADITNIVNSFKKFYTRIILVTFQYYYRNYEFLKSIISDLDNCLFLFRFHPLDYKDEGFREHYITYFSELNNIEYIKSTKADINTLFDIVDLHLTLSSASAIDALNFGVKTILLNKDYAKSHFEMYYNNGVFLTFNSETELKKLILNITKLSSSEMEYYAQNISEVNLKKRLNELIKEFSENNKNGN